MCVCMYTCVETYVWKKNRKSVHLIENKPQTGPQNVKKNIIYAKKSTEVSIVDKN